MKLYNILINRVFLVVQILSEYNDCQVIILAARQIGNKTWFSSVIINDSFQMSENYTFKMKIIELTRTFLSNNVIL